MSGPSAVDASRVADTYTSPSADPTKTRKGPLSRPSVAQAEPAPKDSTDAARRAAKYSNELGAAFKEFIQRNGTNDRPMVEPAKNAIISGLGVDPKNYPPARFHPDDGKVKQVIDSLYHAHAAKKGEFYNVYNSSLSAVLSNRRREFVKEDLRQLNKAYSEAPTAAEKEKVLAGYEGQRALKNAAHWVVTPWKDELSQLSHTAPDLRIRLDDASKNLDSAVRDRLAAQPELREIE
jgi:hypothetical protein